MEINSSFASSGPNNSFLQNTVTPSSDRGRQYGQYTEKELAEIARLKKRDREVRAHEQAHKAAAGQYAGAPQYTYQRGPDGKNYAVGGEVSIDTGAIPGDPEATLRKAQQLQRAALAPAEPSSQDQSVAAEAASMAIKARIELARQERLEQEEKAAPGASDDAANLSNQDSLSQRFNTRSPDQELLNVVI